MTFKPRKGQKFWMLNSRFEIKETVNTGSTKSKGRIRAGNCFKTKTEVAEFKQHITNHLNKKWWEFWK